MKRTFEQKMKWLLAVAIGACLVAAGCGGGSGSPTSNPGVRITISPSATSLLVGAATQFAATVTGSTDTSVTYQVVQGSLGGQILPGGDYLAPNSPGTYTVRAISGADPTKFADASVTVRDYSTSSSRVTSTPDGYEYHTASLLPNGSVLLIGGKGVVDKIHQKALRYSPKDDLYQPDATLSAARMAHVAFTLPSGKIVVAGGIDPTLPLTDFDPVYQSSEIYDPATKTFTAGPDMSVARRHHIATQLMDTRVLITGGIQLRGSGFGASPASEVFDPATNAFVAGKPMNEGRWLHTATLLRDGRVLIVGGRNNNCTKNCPIYSLNSAEIFDPATGAFTPTGSLNISRFDHTATLLADGRVLILGGETTEDLGTGYQQVATSELYDPTTGHFTNWTDLIVPRSGHTTTLLNDGKLWLTGGLRFNSYPSDQTELFDPATGRSVEGPRLNEFHLHHTATQLPGGEVLIVAGNNGAQPGSVVELLD